MIKRDTIVTIKCRYVFKYLKENTKNYLQSIVCIDFFYIFVATN
jgi:hypothetical protein